MNTISIKTSALIGPALDWATAKCEERGVYVEDGEIVVSDNNGFVDYSTDWSQGGQIIERERITLGFRYSDVTTESGTKITIDVGWRAHITPRHFWKMPRYSEGPTPLIAAMRCYVASELGDTVEIPKELIP